jgi:cathepsin L
VVFFCLAATAGAVTFPGERDLKGYSYADYLAEFGKVANGNDQEAVFQANLELIKTHNANPSKTWFATVNQFTDMTNEEFRAMTKGRKEKLFDGVAQPHKLTSQAADLPDSKDWREESNVVTPVKDQGGCGSCWAFSAAQTFESQLAIQTQTAVQKLSPQQIVSCSPNPDQCGGSGGCDGSTQPLAFDYTKTAGLTTEMHTHTKAQLAPARHPRSSLWRTMVATLSCLQTITQLSWMLLQMLALLPSALQQEE